MKRIWFLSLLFVVSQSHAWGEAAKPEEVKIASGGHIVHFLPLDLAVAKGFFADEGLKPIITQLKSGPAPAQALLAGEVDFSMNSIDHAFKAAVQGKDNLRMVVLLNRLPGMVLVVDSRLRDRVKTIADLKGMALGVTSKGSATHMVLAALLTRSALDPVDVTIVDAGAATFAPALENRQIAGGIALEPFASILVEQDKAFVLADLNSLKDTETFLGGLYNQAGVLTRQDTIDKRPELVQKVVAIHVRALQWIHDHTPQEIAAALPAEVVGTDQARYVKTLEKLREFYSPDGMIVPEGVENVYKSMTVAELLPTFNTLKAELFYTNSFVTQALVPKAGVQRPSSSQNDTPKKGDINWPQAVCGFLMGLPLLFLLRWRDGRKKQEMEKRIEGLIADKVQAQRELENERIRITQAAGLTHIPGGLDGFENRICEWVGRAERRIQLCLSTPLLHSLKGRWIAYNDENRSHWPLLFCEPLLKALDERKRVNKPQLRIELIYLDEKAMKRFLGQVLDAGVTVSTVEYLDSIKYFTNKLRENDRSELFEFPVPDVPIYVAMIDGPDGDELPAITSWGAVAFMGAGELVACRKRGESNAEIAKRLQAFEFTNPDICRFFGRLFIEHSLHGDKQLLTFLQHCMRNDYHWAAIADGCPLGDPELIPRSTILYPRNPNVDVPHGPEVPLCLRQKPEAT